MALDLVRALSDLQEKDAMKIVESRLGSGGDPLQILEEATQAMEIVGNRFAKGEYFIPELVFSGEILKEITKRVAPRLTHSVERKRLGKMVLGTVAGDIHDIGKNLVAFMFDVNGFEVFDLGIDVAPQKFVEKIKEVDPQIIGLSGLLTISFNSMKGTVDAIKAGGLREKVKILIGGAQVDDQVMKFAGADAYSMDVMSGLLQAKRWVGGE